MEFTVMKYAGTLNHPTSQEHDIVFLHHCRGACSNGFLSTRPIVFPLPIQIPRSKGV